MSISAKGQVIKYLSVKYLWIVYLEESVQINFISPSYIIHVKHREQELNANNDKSSMILQCATCMYSASLQLYG